MKTITVQELQTILSDSEHMKTAILIDVRTPEEFSQSHIPGAQNKPLDKISLYLDALRTYKQIYVQCRTGGRSSAACGLLDQSGFVDAYNVEGGMSAWESAGFPIE
ncbi:rhodanese-like domain-containing protein [Candidatus Uhrbacteria bacterium]|nr:rhodanese-like domain-containing protein [Candidatus Uhrbacteria bacterium]